jgi:hypothetical protein
MTVESDDEVKNTLRGTIGYSAYEVLAHLRELRRHYHALARDLRRAGALGFDAAEWDREEAQAPMLPDDLATAPLHRLAKMIGCEGADLAADPHATLGGVPLRELLAAVPKSR